LKKRKRQALETKNRIFTAAMSLMEEKGFENVQIEDISRRADVSMGLFYKYFVNKADVITEAYFSITNQEYQDIYDKHLVEAKGFQKLKLMAHYIGELHMLFRKKEDMRWHYTSLLTCSKRGAWVTSDTRTYTKILLEALTEAKELGELSPDADLKEIADQLALIQRGAVFEYLLREENDKSFNLMEASEALVTIYLAGIHALSVAPEKEEPSI